VKLEIRDGIGDEIGDLLEIALEKKQSISIPTTYHGYKITLYSYPPHGSGARQVPIPANITIDLII
jgi:hypothetical protein